MPDTRGVGLGVGLGRACVRACGFGATTDVQPRPLAWDGTGVDVWERPGPQAGRGAWTMGARRSVNFPSEVVEEDVDAAEERRGVGRRESSRLMSWTLRYGS